MDVEEAKRLAAERALLHLPEKGCVGLGTGSTVKYFIEGVARAIKGGRELVGVATSEASRRLATSLGIPLLADAGPWHPHVTVDGADEVSDTLDLIKGGGAAHTREKIVNYASAKNIIVVDETKLSRRLGEKWAVPVEVLPFGHETTRERLEVFGAPRLREKNGAPVVTDSGNLLYDLAVQPIAAPADLDRSLLEIPGVVSTGLFVARADLLIVAGATGVTEIGPPA
ncbi:MAG: ribose-5-phosphate isomerase RpiA [Polyangiaceae bacterium]|nr:ribose-5-phosphate isomerase RpiA [Polyangiaceae bacterium]